MHQEAKVTDPTMLDRGLRVLEPYGSPRLQDKELYVARTLANIFNNGGVPARILSLTDESQTLQGNAVVAVAKPAHGISGVELPEVEDKRSDEVQPGQGKSD